MMIKTVRDERVRDWLSDQFHASILTAAEAAIEARGQIPYPSMICKELKVRAPDDAYKSTPNEIAADAKAKAEKSAAIRVAAREELRRLSAVFHAKEKAIDEERRAAELKDLAERKAARLENLAKIDTQRRSLD